MEKKYLNIDELSSYIFKSKSWIYKKVGTNEIPSIKLGNRLLFEITEIDRWVKNDYTTKEIHLPKI
jgi:excisionase family DNA binding protein